MELRSAVVILNPAASSGGAAARWPAIEHALSKRIPGLRKLETEHQGHATTLCRRALEDGAELVIGVGGDGTNNEILAGFVDAQGNNRFPHATLGIIAAGSGGDFQRQFGVVRPTQQVERLCNAEVRVIDYGLARFQSGAGVEQLRPFLNTASVGVSGLVVQYVNAASRTFGAKAAYIGSSLRGIVNWRNRQAFISLDGGPERRLDLTLMIAANGQYFGAGMWACPHADLSDGSLNMVLLEGMSRLHVATTLGKVFQGKHLRVRGVSTESFKRLTVRPADPDAELLLELDGEQPGRAPVEISVVPRALRILVA